MFLRSHTVQFVCGIPSAVRAEKPGPDLTIWSGLFRFSPQQNPRLPLGSFSQRAEREQGHRGERFDAEICRTYPVPLHRSGREVSEPLHKAGQDRPPPESSYLGEAKTNGVSSRGVGVPDFTARDRLRARTGVRSSPWWSEPSAKRLTICTENSAPGNDNKSSLPGQRTLVVGIDGYVPVHQAYQDKERNAIYTRWKKVR